MKATIIVEDQPNGNVGFHLEFSEPVTDDCTSNAVRAALTMMNALGNEASIVKSDVEEGEMSKPLAIHIQRDGSAYCAFRDDFVNLQESTAGFGDTPGEALEDLLKQEAP